jgi:phage terminase Nu1 subunit (DNA packaging protein)
VSALTRQQLCAELQVSESTVRRWELEGMPCTPVGVRGKRYDLPEIKGWLRNRQCQPGSTKTAAGTSASWSAANAFTASYRRAQLRVLPSN